MNKYLKITCIAVLIFSILLSGCTQENNNINNIINNKVPNEIELVSYNVVSDPGNNYIEVNGAIRKIGNASIDHAIVGVYFYNKENEVIYYGNYSIYSFVKGFDYDFFVQLSSTDPNYEEYDHYSIELDYV